MVGQIMFSPKGEKCSLRRVEIGGMPVLRVGLCREGMFARHKVRRAARVLAEAGVRRVLVPDGFADWELLSSYGLRPIDPLPFLRFHADRLVIAALKRQGREPEKSVVALRAAGTDRDVVRAADRLCPAVRELCISVPKGGDDLRRHLHWEYGAALGPDRPGVNLGVRFDKATEGWGESVLELFPGGRQDIRVSAPLSEEEIAGTQRLSLLAALWECGKVDPAQLEFT